MVNREKVIIDYKVDDKGSSKKIGILQGKIVDLAKKALVMLAAAIGKAVFDFARFKKGITNVYTLLDKGTFNKFGKDLEKGAMATMKKFGFGIEKTNKALFDTISAGVEAGDAIGFLDTAGKLAIGGVTDISIAVDGLTSVMNAYGKENFDATKAANVFFTAQKFGKTTVEALASNIGKIAPIAHAAGMSFEETAAAMSTLTLAGLSTEEATTAVKATLQGVIKPSSDAAKNFKKLGIELVDAEGNMRPFGDILLDIQTATGGNVQKIAELFPNIRALAGASAFASGKLGEYNKILNATKTDTESLNEAFKMQMATMEIQRKVLGSTLQVIGIQFAQKFAPALMKVNEALIKILQAEGVKKFIMGLGDAISKGINIALGFAKALGFVISGLWEIVKPFIPLLKFIAKLVFFFAKLAVVMGLLMNPITWIVAAFVLLGKAISKIREEIKKTGSFMDALKNTGIAAVQGMLTAFKFLIKTISGVTWAVQKLVNLYRKMRGQPPLDLTKGMNNKIDGAIAKLEKLKTKQKEISPEVKQKKDNEKEQNKKEDDLAKIATEEDKKKQLLLEKNQEKNEALAEQETKQREAKKELMAEWKEIDAEEDLIAFEEKLAKLNENGELTTQQEMMIDERRSELKRANWKADFGEWLGIEKLKRVNKKTTAEQLNNWENFMASSTRSKNKEVAAIGKAMAIKEIGIKTAMAAMSAFSAMSGIPIVGPVLGGLAAAAAIAFGAEQISAVNSQSTALAEGGSMIVDQPTRIGNNVIAGEAGAERIDVTPLDQQKPQTINNNIIMDGELIATNVLKIGQEMRSEGTLDDGL